MNANATSGQETDEPTRPAHRNELAAIADEKTLKRARWEHLRLAACPGAHHVNVTNYSYGVEAAKGGEHTYTVAIGPDGLPTECTCPADEYQPGPCKHAVACAADREVLDEAMHGGSDSVRQYTDTDADANQEVATDGGRELTGDHPLDGRCGECGARYTIDETVTNECPECGFSAFERVATDGGERVEDTDGDGARDVSPCPGCGSLTVDDTCGRDRCEGADEIDEAPL